VWHYVVRSELVTEHSRCSGALIARIRKQSSLTRHDEPNSLEESKARTAVVGPEISYINIFGQIYFSCFSEIIVALFTMLHLRLLVIALSALLSTSAALALNARGVENVEQIVDLIQYFDLYPICASYIDEPEFPHTSTHYVGTRTLIVSGTATITDSITQTTSSGTLDVTDLTTVTTTITYAAASNTGITIYRKTSRGRQTSNNQ